MPNAPVLTVAGAARLAASELRLLSDRHAKGQAPPHLAALMLRYARVLDAAAAELEDPIRRPPAQPNPARRRQNARPGARRA